jgi:hypothetical protein
MFETYSTPSYHCTHQELSYDIMKLEKPRLEYDQVDKDSIMKEKYNASQLKNVGITLDICMFEASQASQDNHYTLSQYEDYKKETQHYSSQSLILETPISNRNFLNHHLGHSLVHQKTTTLDPLEEEIKLISEDDDDHEPLAAEQDPYLQNIYVPPPQETQEEYYEYYLKDYTQVCIDEVNMFWKNHGYLLEKHGKIVEYIFHYRGSAHDEDFLFDKYYFENTKRISHLALTIFFQFMHKYPQTKLDYYLIAATCLIVAGKVEVFNKQHITLDYIVPRQEMRKFIVVMEKKILFDVHIRIPNTTIYHLLLEKFKTKESFDFSAVNNHCIAIMLKPKHFQQVKSGSLYEYCVSVLGNICGVPCAP